MCIPNYLNGPLVKLALGVLLLPSCDMEDTDFKLSFLSSDPEPEVSIGVEEEDHVEPSLGLPGIDCLLDERGIRRKILVHVEGARFRRAPGGTPTARVASFFRPYFLFHVQQHNGAPSWYQVGSTPRRDSILGWVPASCAVEWNTRVGDRQLKAPGGRSVPLEVYPRAEDIIERVTTGRTKAQPIARAKASDRHDPAPWPISEVRHAQVDGKTIELHKLMFIGRFGKEQRGSDAACPPEGGYDPATTARIQASVRKIDLVFVVDATGSMDPYIAGVKETVKVIAEKMRDLDIAPDMAYGLWAYRDHGSESEYVTKGWPLQCDHDSLLKSLGNLEASGGGDTREAVYDGVQDAINCTSWRGEGLSHRIVVLMGDCSAHDPGTEGNPRNISAEDLIREATEHNVTLFSLAVGGREELPDRKRRREQFERLSDGTNGKCYEIQQADQIIKRVRTIVGEGSNTIIRRARIVDSKVRGTLEADVADGAISSDAVIEVMEFLGDHGGVEFARLGTSSVAYGSGWVLARNNGAPSTEKRVWLARSELDFLMRELQDVVSNLAPTATRSLFDIGKSSRLGFVREARPATMRAWLQAQGIPSHSESILNFTPDDLAKWPEGLRSSMRERISRSTLPKILEARNSDIYQTIDGIDWGWVSEQILP